MRLDDPRDVGQSLHGLLQTPTSYNYALETTGAKAQHQHGFDLSYKYVLVDPSLGHVSLTISVYVDRNRDSTVLDIPQTQ